MFTGLVEVVGTVASIKGTSPRHLGISSAIPASEVMIGDSVAIDGCCLTVTGRTGDVLTFDAAGETLTRTTIGKLGIRDRVNVERALRLGDRLGGHLVTGHVDGVGVLRERGQKGSALILGVEAPQSVAVLTATRGSITIAGVSLTVTDVQGRMLYVGLVPHTMDLNVTTLGSLGVGDEINLEADLMARYVARLMGYGAAVEGSPVLTEQFLKDKGFA